ncbi:hypothetical protein HDU99_010204 [Rhizoclosmatium hyalinum]|nr:hypothetical protein HDU99_010204 [Rhizoclosmatium hyalinum]
MEGMSLESGFWDSHDLLMKAAFKHPDTNETWNFIIEFRRCHQDDEELRIFMDPKPDTRREYQDSIANLLECFGAEGNVKEADDIEFERIWCMFTNFLISAAWGAFLMDGDRRYVQRWSITGKVPFFGGMFVLEHSLGYRELLDHRYSAVDGYFCMGGCDYLNGRLVHRKMEEWLDKGKVPFE